MPKIKSVAPPSLAQRAGIVPGDVLVTINDFPIIDFLDYVYHSSDSRLILELSDRTVEIENEHFENLGLEFETMLIDQPKMCKNKCIFCFIDQNAPKMRDSIRFKDDDYRLSFLQGNYISLTNLTDADIARIIDYNIPRINVSVHTANPELRVKMLGNPNAGNVLEVMNRLAEGGVTLNCQIVLCRGINDGEELIFTTEELCKLAPAVESVSVVPVGLTKFRQNLAELTPFDKSSATAVIRDVENCQAKLLDKLGTRFVYLADEFYLLAELPIPPFDDYEDFPQIENGVGLMANFRDEFDDARTDESCSLTKKTVITGVAAYKFITELAESVAPQCQVIPIKNEFFGENITVAGLVTGQDIINQLRGRNLGSEVLIPKCMLKSGEDVFLDDITIADIEVALGVKVKALTVDGYEFYNGL